MNLPAFWTFFCYLDSPNIKISKKEKHFQEVTFQELSESAIRIQIFGRPNLGGQIGLIQVEPIFDQKSRFDVRRFEDLKISILDFYFFPFRFGF